MAKVVIDPVAVRRNAQRITVPVVTNFAKEVTALSKRWPRAGNPAWTDSYGTLNRATTYTVYKNAPGGPFATVSNPLDYAMAVHEGTPARLIVSHKKYGMNFWWKREGRPGRRFHVVRHPRTKGSHFLSEPMQIVAKRHGFKVTTRVIP